MAQRAAQRWLSDHDSSTEIITKKRNLKGYFGQVKEDKGKIWTVLKGKWKIEEQMSGISVKKKKNLSQKNSSSYRCYPSESRKSKGINYPKSSTTSCESKLISAVNERKVGNKQTRDRRGSAGVRVSGVSLSRDQIIWDWHQGNLLPTPASDLTPKNLQSGLCAHAVGQEACRTVIE